MLLVYDWLAFRLEYEPATGEAFTRYPDGHSSGCGVVDGDRWHAARLGISPQHHRLAHELLHHLVGLYVYRAPTGSPVVWRDAHGIPQDAGGEAKPGWSEAAREEWFVTALTYLTFGRTPDWGALMDLEALGIDVCELRAEARHLLNAAETHPMGLTLYRSEAAPEAA